MRASLLCVALCAPSLFGQALSAEITPTPAPMGSPVTLTVTARTAIEMPSGCAYSNVRFGSPTGGITPANIFCLTFINTLTPGQTVTTTFSTSARIRPGTYWFETQWRPLGSTGPWNSEFFCFDYRSPSVPAPTLTAANTARIGQPLDLNLADGQRPGEIYIAAASLTSNQPLLVNGVTSCLDADALFALSFPNPLPGIFNNFLGVLDATGNATGIQVVIPADPALLYLPLKVQAAVLDPLNGAILSNGVNFTVQS